MPRVSTPIRAVLALRRRAAKLIAIDGKTGVGKSTLARLLSTRLQLEVVHLDAFLRSGRGTYVTSLRLNRLRRKVNVAQRCLVEGVCVLRVLELLGKRPDALVYVKRMSGARWTDEDELDVSTPVEEHLAQLLQEMEPFAHALNEPCTLGVAEEVIRYHAQYKPHKIAVLEYLRSDA